ncbi:MAG: site-2 protease family protein [Bacteroidota bacterium]
MVFLLYLSLVLKSITYCIGSFLVALLTTTLAGVNWLNRDPLELANFSYGLTYSSLLLFILASHEFGHYLAARRHLVDVTLPLFIPFPSVGVLGLLNPFGTLGAVIRLKSQIPSRRVLFDIGASGPIAGFVASILVLTWGFSSLPSIEYLHSIHPEYAFMEDIPEGGWKFGEPLMFSFMARLFAPHGAFIPPMNEVYHYPSLCVGWFGLLVTSINLIPAGQLDGGHISYAMFGNRYHLIAGMSIVLLFILGLAGFLPDIGIPISFGYTGWLFWALLLVFSIRVLKLNRPAVEDQTPLDPMRKILGWICCLIFVLSFSLVPFTFSAAVG